MEASFSAGRIRKDFSKIDRIIDIPNLIDIQNRSFERFLQADVALEKPKYDVQECLQRGMTYAAPIKVTIRLIVWDNPGEGHQNIRDVKEQEVYFGEIPVMT